MIMNDDEKTAASQNVDQIKYARLTVNVVFLISR